MVARALRDGRALARGVQEVTDRNAEGSFIAENLVRMTLATRLCQGASWLREAVALMNEEPLRRPPGTVGKQGGQAFIVSTRGGFPESLHNGPGPTMQDYKKGVRISQASR